MRSASSTCAGSPEDMRPATYFTSGEYATTSCSRARSEPVLLYRRQRSRSSIALTFVSTWSLCPGMAACVGCAQPRGLYPSVDLGRADGCVAKELLDRPQVRAALQQMGREGVAQRVRMHLALRLCVARP